MLIFERSIPERACNSQVLDEPRDAAPLPEHLRRHKAPLLPEVSELDAVRHQRYVAPHCYVYVIYGLGERDQALLHQEDAYRDGGQPLNYFSPFIRNLYSLDPTHRDRLRQMRLSV